MGRPALPRASWRGGAGGLSVLAGLMSAGNVVLVNGTGIATESGIPGGELEAYTFAQVVGKMLGSAPIMDFGACWTPNHGLGTISWQHRLRH